MQQPPLHSMKKRAPKAPVFWIIFLVVICVIGIIAASIIVRSQWHTTHTFTSASGNQSTETFTASGSWRLAWRCSIDASEEIVITVSGSTGELLHYPLVSDQCHGTDTITDTIPYGGDITLNIISSLDWIVTVQEQG